MITDKIGPHHLERGAIPIRRGAARLRRRSRQRGIVSSLVGMPMRLALGKTKLDRVAPQWRHPNARRQKRWQARP